MTALSLNAALDKYLAWYHQARCRMQDTYRQEMGLLPDSTKSLIANTQPLESYDATVPATNLFTAFTREQLDKWHSQDIRYHNWMRICLELIAARKALNICLKRAATNQEDGELSKTYQEKIHSLKDLAKTLTRYIREEPIPEIDDCRGYIQTIQETALAALPNIRAATA